MAASDGSSLGCHRKDPPVGSTECCLATPQNVTTPLRTSPRVTPAVFPVDKYESSHVRPMGTGDDSVALADHTGGSHQCAGDLHARQHKKVRQQVRFVPEVRALPASLAMECSHGSVGETLTTTEQQQQPQAHSSNNAGWMMVAAPMAD
eukprot:4020818-Amphidinium_carterae.1